MTMKRPYSFHFEYVLMNNFILLHIFIQYRFIKLVFKYDYQNLYHELFNHFLIVVNVIFVHTRKNLGPYSTTYPSLKTLYFSRLLDSCTLQLRIVQYCKPLVLFNIGIHTSCLVPHQTHSPEYVYILCCNYIKRLLFSLS